MLPLSFNFTCGQKRLLKNGVVSLVESTFSRGHFVICWLVGFFWDDSNLIWLKNVWRGELSSWVNFRGVVGFRG